VEHRVGVLSVADPFGNLPQRLPPGQKSVEYAVFCPPGCTRKFPEAMNVFASMTHAHLRARHVITSVGQPGPSGQVPEGGWKDVVESAAGAFAHDEQHFEPANFTIGKGDSLRTVCRYDTRKETAPVMFGPATSDEMCMQVFLYWPKQYTFLCGYFGEKVYWCGDAGGFVRKSGSDEAFHSDTCMVGSSAVSVDGGASGDLSLAGGRHLSDSRPIGHDSRPIGHDSRPIGTGGGNEESARATGGWANYIRSLDGGNNRDVSALRDKSDKEQDRSGKIWMGRGEGVNSGEKRERNRKTRMTCEERNQELGFGIRHPKP